MQGPLILRGLFLYKKKPREEQVQVNNSYFQCKFQNWSYLNLECRLQTPKEPQEPQAKGHLRISLGTLCVIVYLILVLSLVPGLWSS